jgi:formate C-acetyltransferase
MQGMDQNGPTAVFSSALKAGLQDQALANILTMKIPPSFLETDELKDKVVALTEGFLGAGGTYIQYNIMDAKLLKEAQRDPENYKDLMVRVGGFSAYFISLSPEIQEEVIQRTEHAF